MSDDISLPQIIVSEVVPNDMVLVLPVISPNGNYTDAKLYNKAISVLVSGYSTTVTTDNNDGTYTHTYIPNDAITFKFVRDDKWPDGMAVCKPNRIPRLPIMLNEKFLGSTFGNWLQSEGINHEVNQEVLRRILAWQHTKQPILNQNYNDSSLNQVLTGYQAKPLANLYEISYGVLSKFKKVR